MTDLALFHRTPDRLQRYPELDDLFWSDNLSAWVTADADVIRQALRNRDLAVIDFRLIHGALAERFRIDFAPSVRILDHVALGLNGAEHTAARRRQTLYIKSISAPAIAAFETRLDEVLATLLREGAEVCLARQVILPAVEAMFEVMSGFAISDDRDPSLSLIFDRMLSVNRRRKVNERIRDLMAEQREGEDLDDLTMRIALSIVGADSLFSTLSQSLQALLAQNEGRALNAIAWPTDIPETGVPYVDRIASAEVELAGRTIKKGQRLRIYVEALKRPENAPTPEFFGVGTHVCLGKALSMQAWKILTARLSALPVRLSVLEHRYRKNDYLFNAAETILVEVRHG